MWLEGLCWHPVEEELEGEPGSGAKVDTGAVAPSGLEVTRQGPWQVQLDISKETAAWTTAL